MVSKLQSLLFILVVVTIAFIFTGFTPASDTAAHEPGGPSQLEPGDEAVVAAGDDCLNLRSAAGLDKPIENCLATGVSVTILGGPVSANNYTWVEIEHWAGNTGWVAAEYLEKAGTGEPTERAVAASVPEQRGGQALVETGGSCLNFREGPGLEHDTFTCLADGTQLDVLGESVGADGHTWVHVARDNGERGWVADEYLLFFDLGPAIERQVIGTSLQGRDIEAITVGDGPHAIMLVGGIHTGPEAETVDLVRALKQHFAYSAARLPAELKLVFVPNANPDGYALGTRVNARGVDLNRNWPASDWREDAVHGDSPTSGGTEPLSEPETRALFDFIVGVEPLFVLSYHGYASLVEDNGHGVSELLSAAYAATSGYEHISEWTHYEVTGGFIEALEEHGIAAADVELAHDDAASFERNLRGVQAVIDAVAALD